MASFLSRTPFALVGAFGFIGLISNFVELAESLKDWVDAWRWLTQTIWGWIPFDIGWLKDYLTMGLITIGMAMRKYFWQVRDDRIKYIERTKSTVGDFLLVLSLWPLNLLLQMISSYKMYRGSAHDIDWERTRSGMERLEEPEVVLQFNRESMGVYWESFFYAGLILAASFAFSR